VVAMARSAAGGSASERLGRTAGRTSSVVTGVDGVVRFSDEGNGSGSVTVTAVTLIVCLASSSAPFVSLFVVLAASLGEVVLGVIRLS
jgi:hypothetical protein